MINDISVPDWNKQAEQERDHTGPNNVIKESDGLGGFIVTARLPKAWVAGQLHWIEIDVSAKRPWCGYLSFSARTDRRAFDRRRFVVTEGFC